MRASYEEQPRRRPGIGLEWRTRAACRNRDPGPWMSEGLASVTVAKQVCNDECPVRLSCLGAALDWEAQTGVPDPLIFGGMTPGERMALISRRRR